MHKHSFFLNRLSIVVVEKWMLRQEPYLTKLRGFTKIIWDCIYREYVYSVVVYQKYLTGLGELIIFEPWRGNYHFSQQSKVFLIYGNTIYVV